MIAEFAANLSECDRVEVATQRCIQSENIVRHWPKLWNRWSKFCLGGFDDTRCNCGLPKRWHRGAPTSRPGQRRRPIKRQRGIDSKSPTVNA